MTNLCFCVELKKFRHYQIVMTSYNIIGESPPSAPAEVSVGEAGKRKLREDFTFSQMFLLHAIPPEKQPNC